ncbi:hypothetical protein AHAS_Ahas20G0156400 [Arachis hypogaea]
MLLMNRPGVLGDAMIKIGATSFPNHSCSVNTLVNFYEISYLLSYNDLLYWKFAVSNHFSKYLFIPDAIVVEKRVLKYQFDENILTSNQFHGDGRCRPSTSREWYFGKGWRIFANEHMIRSGSLILLMVLYLYQPCNLVILSLDV